ncbi:MAG: cyclic nucleotide-binding domain-containing protein [Chloroflexota bacterium]|nr:MAG: cyclic nucleotide-binding domain-containing protein [Chloroflexota bacterium]
MDLLQLLKRCEAFVGLDDNELEKIADLPTWRKDIYSAGDFIFHEGAVSQDFYVLEEGEISLLVASRKRGTKELVQVAVDTVTRGDVFGWSSLVAPHSRNMSAVCVKRSTVVAVSGAELNELMDSNHSLGYEVMKSLVRVIARRLRDLQEELIGEEKLSPRKEIRPE